MHNKYTGNLYINFQFQSMKSGKYFFLLLFAASNTVNAVNSMSGCCSEYMNCYVFHCPLVVVSP